jgi:molybdopterin converting factor subunit 1
MKVKVLLFGFTRDLTGFGQEQLEIPEGESLAGLWGRYARRFPRLSEMRDSLLLAVNQEIADLSQTLRDGDEVAFMPPVGGGAGEDFYRLTRDPIPTADLPRQLKAPQDGAVVVFEGIVRDHSRGHKTLYLEYEAYEPMAVRKMQEIGQETRQKFAIDCLGIIHRLGRLEVGETSVAIIVTAAHRPAAFEACRYAIDRLKQIVPIWKKEYFEGGAVWAEGEGGSSAQQSALKGQPEARTEDVSGRSRLLKADS